jgi:hypothetical protein
VLLDADPLADVRNTTMVAAGTLTPPHAAPFIRPA